MSDQISINVQTRADTSGFTAAEQAAQKSAATFAGLSAQEQKAAAAALQLSTAAQRLATEEQRTAQTANQAAVAAQRLATEEQRTATALAQAAAAQTRAAASALSLAQAQDRAANSAKRGGDFATQMGSAFSSSLMGIVGPAAIAAGAIKAISEVGELARLGAQAQLVETRFTGLAEAAHTTGDALMSALRQASGGEISDLNLQLAANRAQLLGVADSAEEFGVLMGIARDRAQQMGISTTQAFNDLVTGLGRGSALILDNLGILVSVEDANKAYAASLGTTVEKLTDAEKKQALINQVVAQGKATFEATGGAVESTAGSFAQLDAAGENAKNAAGELLAVLLKFPAEVTTKILISISDNWNRIREFDSDLEKTGVTAVAVSDDYDAYASKLQFVNKELGTIGASVPGISRAQFDYAKSLQATGSSADEAVAKAKQFGDVINAVKMTSGEWLATNTELQNQLIALASTGGGYTDAVNNLSGALLRGEIDTGTFTSATAMLSAQQEQSAQIAAYDALEQNRLTMMHYAGAAAAQEAAAAAAIDTMEKERDTLQTQLLAEQTQIATDAFLAANPAINASGIQAAVTAGAISPLIGRLAELTLQIRQAKAELGGIAMGRPETGGDAIARSLNSATASQRFLTTQTERATAAQRQQVLATGSAAQKANILKENYEAAVRSFGRGSAQAIDAQTKLIQAQQSAAKGGGGGRAGGAADKAAKAAEATGTRLGDIARQGGSKLEDIEEATQSKLAAIDAKYAEQRAESQRALFEEIARMSAGEAYSQQFNDFEQFGKDLSDEQKALFAEREQSEIRYNERIKQAQDAARAEATNGDADLASEKLKIREAEAKRQMEIENRAAQASIDSEGKNAAAIAQTAAEASAESQRIADTDIAIAEAKAAEKAGAMQAEKDAVIASANEQAAKVIEAATEQANKVKGASESQKSTVISNLRAQADAAGAWADAIEAASRRAGSAMGGVNGPPVGGGGEEGGTTGETAGETGGPSGGGGQGIRGGQGIGRSASGGGGSSLTDAISTLNDAAAIITILKPFVAANKGAVKLLNEYKLVVQAAVGSLLAIQDLRARLVAPQPVLDLAVVARLKQDVEAVVGMMFDIDASMTSKVRVLTKYLELETAAIDILNGVMELRGKLSQPTPPIDLNYVRQLHQEGQAVVQLLLGSMMPINQQQMTLLQRYSDGQGRAVQILSDVADLRTRLSEDTGSAFDMGLIRGLAKRAAEITRIVDMQLVPLTEEQAAGFSQYADAAGAAVQVLIDVVDLRTRLSEDTGQAFDMGLINGLAMRAAEISRIVQSYLVPTTEETAEGFSRYADSVGASVQVLTDVTDLRTRLSEDTGTAFDMGLIKGLAQQAAEISRIVRSTLIPTSEDQAEGFSAYADSVSSAVGIISDVAGLRKDAQELASPIPREQIESLAIEAKRITQIVQSQLIPTTEDTAAGFSAYADAVSSAVGIISDVAGLRKDAMDLAGPIPEQAIIAVADEAKRITQIVLSRMIPASEEQAEAAKRYADTTGSAVQALSDVLGFSGKLFADYVSPSDAQLDRVVIDANRIVKRVDAAAKVYGADGLEAAQAFGDATGSILSAFKEQLLFAQAVGGGDFAINPANLAAFELGMGQTLAVASRLGAQAAMIPPGNIVALQNTTAALTSAYESMIRLSAVPFGNIPQLTAGLGGGGGGGQNIIVNINNPPANVNVAALQQQVMQGVSRALAGKR